MRLHLKNFLQIPSNRAKIYDNAPPTRMHLIFHETTTTHAITAHEL